MSSNYKDYSSFNFQINPLQTLSKRAIINIPMLVTMSGILSFILKLSSKCVYAQVFSCIWRLRNQDFCSLVHPYVVLSSLDLVNKPHSVHNIYRLWISIMDFVMLELIIQLFKWSKQCQDLKIILLMIWIFTTESWNCLC